jgi:reactive intermediate/imine deaminase
MAGFQFLNPATVGRPAGPYQHAVKVEGWLFLAGQIPVNPDMPDAPAPSGIEAQTELVFRNIRAILAEAGYELSEVVQVRNYLRELKRDMAGFNSVYARQFEPDRYPPRTTIGVAALAKDVLVEIDLVAYRRP